jgi:hypothetical protein
MDAGGSRWASASDQQFDGAGENLVGAVAAGDLEWQFFSHFLRIRSTGRIGLCRVPARRPVRAAAQADGRMGALLRAEAGREREPRSRCTEAVKPATCRRHFSGACAAWPYERARSTVLGGVEFTLISLSPSPSFRKR